MWRSLDEWSIYSRPRQIQFKKFFSEDAWVLTNSVHPTVFPAGADLPEPLIESIKSKFWEYEIGRETPADFLRDFHNLINNGASRWKILLESEQSYTADMGIYNATGEQIETYSESSTQTQSASYNPATNSTTAQYSPADNQPPEDIQSAPLLSASRTSTAGSDTSDGNTSADREYTLKRERKENIGVDPIDKAMAGFQRLLSTSVMELIYNELKPCFLLT